MPLPNYNFGGSYAGGNSPPTGGYAVNANQVFNATYSTSTPTSATTTTQAFSSFVSGSHTATVTGLTMIGGSNGTVTVVETGTYTSQGNQHTVYNSISLTEVGYQDSNHMLLKDASNNYYILSTSAITAGTITDLQNTAVEFSCFAAGTMILTPDGEVAIENLKVGDLVVTTSGNTRPIRWLGHRSVNCRLYPAPTDVWPVRISAGAFGEHKPSKDLLLSPGHAVAVTVLDEVLIPAVRLVNGATIQQVEQDEITYWHVELDVPDVLIANGLPAETFIDANNRGFFEGEKVSSLFLSEARIAGVEYARPRLEEGEAVRAVRERLLARAVACGWTQAGGSLERFHALVDGARIEAQVHQGVARFLVPAAAKDVRLISDVGVPSEVVGAADSRKLGVCVTGLAIDDGLMGRRDIALDDPRLSEGFHALEQVGGTAQRWTRGNTPLPATLWAGCQGMFFLQVTTVAVALHWVAPSKPVVDEGAPHARLRLVSGL
jgi:hypothetical protein